jgi:hypothetical protein
MDHPEKIKNTAVTNVLNSSEIYYYSTNPQEKPVE